MARPLILVGFLFVFTNLFGQETCETSPGNPEEYGLNQWYAYAYNVQAYNDSVFDLSNYRGFYTHDGLNFDSRNKFTVFKSPSDVDNYLGCTVDNNRHTVSYKRKGFPCGYYSINIGDSVGLSGHDDAAKLFVDDSLIWYSKACCQVVMGVWEGFLGPDSRVEFIWSENDGGSFGSINFDKIKKLNAGKDITLCPGTEGFLIAEGGNQYDWTENTTYLLPPYDKDSIVCSPIASTEGTNEVYIVKSIDTITNCTLSDTINVSFNTTPDVKVSPENAGPYEGCSASTVLAQASGAYLYEWEPSQTVRTLSKTEHTVLLNPVQTTTYKVTGSTNCGVDSAFVSIIMDAKEGVSGNFGKNQWYVSVYSDTSLAAYEGFYVHNVLNFNSESKWDKFTSPSFSDNYNGCEVGIDSFSFSYRREGFPCGIYQLDLPRHDDAIAIMIDGKNIFKADTANNVSVTPGIWQGYLGPNSRITVNIKEIQGGSRGGLTFKYLFGPGNRNTEAAWNGKFNSNWSDSRNWCGFVPSNLVSAYIPENAMHQPEITTSSSVKSLNINKMGSLSIPLNQNLAVYKDLKNDGSITGKGTVIFTGGEESIISGGKVTDFYNLTVNKFDNKSILLSQDMALSGNLYFVSGLIISNQNTVTFRDNSSSQNPGQAGYITGKVKKEGDDTFIFPVGNSQYYAPVEIATPENVNEEVSVQYFKALPPFDVSSRDSSLKAVSNAEYWNIETNGLSDIEITLSWSFYRSGRITEPNELVVAKWLDTAWVNLGASGFSGNTLSGSVSAEQLINNSAVLTLGSVSTENSLLTELIRFEGFPLGNKVLLTWETVSEINLKNFIIEKSTDNLNWEPLASLKALGSATIYNYTDNAPFEGTNWYRLKISDNEGGFYYSPAILITIELSKEFSLLIYPNPVGSQPSTLQAERRLIDGKINIYDNRGRLVKTFSNVNEAIIPLDLFDLAPGIYFLRVEDKKSNGRIKFIKH